jgi:hypothetical protein
MEMTNSPKTMVKIPEATRILLGPDADPRRGYELASQGRLPGLVRIGRTLRVDLEKLIAFIEQGGKVLPGGWKREPEGRPSGR